MSGEQPVPETLETVAASIRELRTSIDQRFDTVDERFGSVDARLSKLDEHSGSVDAQLKTVNARFDKVDTRFDEMKAQLRTEIESVRGDVKLVGEGLAAQTVLLQGMDKDHRRLEERVDKHDVRISALEPKMSA